MMLFPIIGTCALASLPVGMKGFFSQWYGISNFAPNNLDGLVAWYDASDQSTISVQAGTNLVTQWASKVVPSVNLSGTVGERPNYLTNNFNGLPGIRFSLGTRLQNQTTSIFSNQPYGAIFAVARVTGGDAARTIFGVTVSGFFRATVWVTSTNDLRAGGRRVTGDAFQGFAISSYATNSVVIMSSLFNYADAELFGGSNNTFTNLSTSFQAAGNTGTNNTEFGFGANPAGSATARLIGDIFEVLVYHRKISDAERSLIVNYLNKKWGVF